MAEICSDLTLGQPELSLWNDVFLIMNKFRT